MNGIYVMSITNRDGMNNTLCCIKSILMTSMVNGLTLSTFSDHDNNINFEYCGHYIYITKMLYSNNFNVQATQATGSFA